MTDVIAFLVGVFADVFNLFTDMLPNEYIVIFVAIFTSGLVVTRLIKPFIAQFNRDKGGD